MERYGGGGGDGGGNRCLEEVEVELRLYRTLGGGIEADRESTGRR